MSIVSVTRFRTRARRFLPLFMFHAQRSLVQVRRAAGYFAGAVQGMAEQHALPHCVVAGSTSPASARHRVGSCYWRRDSLSDGSERLAWNLPRAASSSHARNRLPRNALNGGFRAVRPAVQTTSLGALLPS